MRLSSTYFGSTSVSTTQTINTSYQLYLADASSGSITLTLPPASSNEGFVLNIKKTDNTTSLVTIDGNGSETIDGDLTKDLTIQYESVAIVSDGSNWSII